MLVYSSLRLSSRQCWGGYSTTESRVAAMEAKLAAEETARRQAVVDGGWRVDCSTDHHKAERRCFAGSFDVEGRDAFQIVYVNRRGPVLYTPHDFPGRVPTVRVDDGPVIPATNPNGILTALTNGRTAYVVYHRWPMGEVQMTVDVAGFAEAYSELLAIL